MTQVSFSTLFILENNQREREGHFGLSKYLKWGSGQLGSLIYHINFPSKLKGKVMEGGLV